MLLDVMGIVFHKGMDNSEINDEKRLQFIETSFSNEKLVVLRSKKPAEFQGVRFRIVAFFYNDKLNKVSLIAVANQNNEKYINCKNTKELHEKWLISNYGEPNVIEMYGYKYNFMDFKICSEYDPRSGSAEIFFLFDL